MDTRTPAVVDTTASVLRFIYPFHYDAATFTARTHTIAGSEWQLARQPRRVWRPERYPHDDIPPHIARYLPLGASTDLAGMAGRADRAGGAVGEIERATALLWGIDDDACRSPAGLGAGRPDQLPWYLALQNGRRLQFELQQVQLTLFRTGVGFISVEIKPDGDSVADWHDFVHYFRFVTGQRGVRLYATRRTGRDTFAPHRPCPRLVSDTDEVPGDKGGHEEEVAEDFLFGDVVRTLLRTGELPVDTVPWYHDVFVPGQLLPYTTLFVDGQAPDEDAALVYRARNFFHVGQRLHLDAQDRRLDEHPGLLPYADRQWFAFSLDGGGFVACDAPRDAFFRETLPDHLQNHYYLLFLLAQHQRFALIGLTEDVAEHWLPRQQAGSHGDAVGEHDPADEEHVAVFGRIRDALLEFTARNYFVQVMQREHHHRCYRKWREVLQIDEWYRTVHDEVREMDSYLQARRDATLRQIAGQHKAESARRAEQAARRERVAQERSQSLERRLTIVAVGIAVPALIIGFLGINLVGITTDSEGLYWWQAVIIIVVAALVLGGTLGLLLAWRRGQAPTPGGGLEHSIGARRVEERDEPR